MENKVALLEFRKFVRKELNTLYEFYLGSNKVVGIKFKFKEPLALSNGKKYNAEDTWVIDKAEDDDHYCTNTKTGDKDIFHTDIMLGDTIMDKEAKKAFGIDLDEDFGEQLNSANCMEQPEVCMSKPEQIMDPRPEM